MNEIIDGLKITVGNDSFLRFPLRTHVITPGESMPEIVQRYTSPHLRAGDSIVISERIVAISQGRSFPIQDIHPGWWARHLYPFVHNHPGGIGLRDPHTMQLAIQEAGVARILLAGVASAVTKPFGIKGVFYHVAGHGINAIDGPCDYTLPPGNTSAKLGPKDPEKVCREIAQRVGYPVAIIDANDYGVNVLGASEGVDKRLIHDAFLDNPMGQSDEQTPITILRRVA